MITARSIADYLATLMKITERGIPDGLTITGPSTISTMSPHSFGYAGDGAKIPRSDGPDFLLLSGEEAASAWSGPLVITERPRLAFAHAMKHFFAHDLPPAGAHPTAVIAADAQIDATASIGPHCHIGPGCVVGARTRIGAGTVLVRDVRIGDDCVVRSCVVIGGDGFGVEEFGDYETIRIPHVGGVRIGNRVEIGSQVTIDAGTIEPTVIEDEVQTDNQVHIAHNDHIGKGSLLAASAALSGSVVLGRGVWLAPNSTIIQKVEIGDDCFVGIGSTVCKSSEPNAVLVGSPARRLKSRR